MEGSSVNLTSMTATAKLRSLLSQARDRAHLVVDVPRELAFMVPGLAYFGVTGQTPFRAYGSMRRLYGMTNGLSSEAVHAVIRRMRPTIAMDSTTGALGDMNGAYLEKVLQSLDGDGYYVFEQHLSDETVDEIRRFALRTPCTPNGDPSIKPVLFDATTERASTVYFRSEDLVRCDPLRALMLDRSMLALAQSFLRSQVVMDTPRMWWSTPGSGQPSSTGAQLFHVDIDRLRWLNFFFYLTDVDGDTGPHCYVRNSQRGKPLALQKDGRYSDADIASHYPDRSVEIGGRRGTIFVADTRGFHKGMMLRKGTRLLFQMVFADSLFGQTYEAVHVAQDLAPDFSEVRHRFPYTYSSFVFPQTA